MTKLLSINSDAKTTKGVDSGFLTGALFMTPERHGRTNVCPFATKACRASCIYETGHGAFANVRSARERRREAFDAWKRTRYSRRHPFALHLAAELAALTRKAERSNMRPAVRLNATSDVQWERVAPWIFDGFPGVQFYDYTKWPQDRRAELPPNYALAWSWHDGMTDDEAESILGAGGRLAVPFAPTVRGADFPTEWNGWTVADGDQHDLIFRHPPHTVIGLRFKGKGGSRPTYSPGIFAVPYGPTEDSLDYWMDAPEDSE